MTCKYVPGLGTVVPLLVVLVRILFIRVDMYAYFGK